jgi:hypothetical protein
MRRGREIEKNQHVIFNSQTGSGDVVPKPLGTTHANQESVVVGADAAAATVIHMIQR